MQTHEDNDFQDRFMERLRERSEKAKAEGGGGITAGRTGEPILAEWKQSGVHVRHLPDDEQGILRISLGGTPHSGAPFRYCTIRGSVGQCIKLLEDAIQALRAAP